MARYPDNWKTWIVPQIKRRSGYRCECCGVQNGHRGWWRGQTFNRCTPANPPPDFVRSRVIRIALDVVAMDYRIHNCHLMNHRAPAPPVFESNLRAYCQRCAARHEMNRPKRKKRQKSNKQPVLIRTENKDKCTKYPEKRYSA